MTQLYWATRPCQLLNARLREIFHKVDRNTCVKIIQISNRSAHWRITTAAGWCAACLSVFEHFAGKRRLTDNLSIWYVLTSDFE